MAALRSATVLIVGAAVWPSAPLLPPVPLEPQPASSVRPAAAAAQAKSLLPGIPMELFRTLFD